MNWKYRNIPALFLGMSLLLIPSCLENEYCLSEDRISPEITLFQDGLSLPLGKTAPITLNSLMAQLDENSKQFFISKNGAYRLFVQDTLNLNESLAELSDAISIDKLNFSEEIPLDLSEVDLSGLSVEIPPIDPIEVKLSTLLETPDITLPSISLDPPFSFSESIPSPNKEQMTLNLDPVSTQGRFASIHPSDMGILYSIATEMGLAETQMTYTEILDLAKDKGYEGVINIKTDIDEESYSMPMSFEFPEEIKAIKEITFNEEAQIELSVEMIDPFFDGMIKPTVDVDVSQFLHIKPDANEAATLEDHLKHNFVITSSNGWKDVYTYSVLSLAVKEEDFVKQPNGKLTLNKNARITASGKIDPSGLVTTPKQLYDNREKTMMVRMEAKFHNFVIGNIKMEIEPIVFTQEITVPIDINDISLPDMVKEIEYLEFDTNHPLQLEVQSTIPNSLKNLNISVEQVKMDFPAGFEVNHPDFDATNHSLTLFKNHTLSSGLLEENIAISRLYLPKPVGNILQFNESLKVTASARAEGILNSRDLIGQEESEMSIYANAHYQPVLSDYSIITNDYPYDIDIHSDPINESLPAEVGKMDQISVQLEKVAGKDPAIVITINHPESDAVSILPKKDEGMHLIFPKFIVLGDLGVCQPYYNANYSEKCHSISFTDDNPIPRTIVIPIKRLDIIPEPVEGKEGEYVVSGQIETRGGVRLAGTRISKKELDSFKENDAKISVDIEIPTLTVAQLSLGEYSTSINEKFSIDKIDLGSMPEMIKSVDEIALHEVELSLVLDASDLSKILGEVEMNLNLDVRFPELIEIEGTDANNQLHIESSLNDKHQIVIGPYQVKKLDLSSVDFSQEEVSIENLEIQLNGQASLSNLNIDLKDLEEESLSLKVNGQLASKDSDKILLEKISAVVDYQIEPVHQAIDLGGLNSALGENIDMTLDLYRFSAALDIKTNLGIPVGATISLTPYKAGVAMESLRKYQKIQLKHAPSAQDTCHTRLWISNLNQDCPAGYEWVKMDLPAMIKEAADSIVLGLEAGTLQNAACIFEPQSDYILEATYALEIPLELGEDFKIEYSDTVELPAEIEQVLSKGSLGLGGTFTNSLPIQLEVEFALLDDKGVEIPLIEGAGKQIIQAGAPDGSPVESELKILLGLKDKIGEDIPTISALKFTLIVSSGGVGGTPFRENGFVQAELRALIPEGIHLDINELEGGESYE